MQAQDEISVDQAPADGGKPLFLFESGAILVDLADKTGQFIAKDLRGRDTALQWRCWQMGGLGPMAGKNHHFVQYAPERLPCASIATSGRRLARIFHEAEVGSLVPRRVVIGI